MQIISSPYSVPCNLRVCCRYTLQFFNGVNEVSVSVFKFFTFEIRWAVISVSVNVEGLVFVQQRYLESIMKGYVSFSLKIGEQTFLHVSS